MKTTLTVLTVAALLLAGCADMKNIGPGAELRGASELGLPAVADPQALSPAADWWTNFGDPQLDRLVAEALAGNPNLRVAAARVNKAQAGVAFARSADWPQVNGELSLNRQKFSSNYIYPAPLGGSVQNIGNLQAGMGWELDFFGKHSGELLAALGQVRAAEAERDAARVLLTSNVVRAYLQWARLLGQREVAERTLTQRQQMLGLVQDRVKAGLDNQLEVRQSETGRADTRTSIAVLNQQIDASRNALAALMGQPRLPDGIAPPKLTQFKPMAIPGELSADWLGRRADIVAARWRVEAARGEVQVARAQFYPNINLAAFVGVQSIGFDNLLKSGSMQWGVGPAIKLPIFEAGRLRANLRGKSADVDSAIESYNATVIDAMRDVSDQSQGVRAVALQQSEQVRALRAAEGAYDIAQQRYKAGLGTYLHVLSAETSVLAQRRQQVDLEVQALLGQVGLAQAMGGGWQPSPEHAVLQSQVNAH
ncbi:efflux transporter outer membrane subunit [Ottowia thiooxydans]|uniref:efflux transporter outer membrane subunit n=1 Tax=Ottowia thiooxydans TaxID=219182 RepID=UPI0004266C82|nr:efflux transporter outer membrane subunit [Ottowia thiooxydans]